MAPRLESMLLMYPRSGSTLVQFGLNDEAFTVPQLEFPTQIYRSLDPATNQYSFYTHPTDSTELIHPVVNGSIVDLDAFLNLIKLIYVSILAEKHKQNPENAFTSELSNIPFLLISHHSWSQYQLEKITQFVFETLKIKNFMFLPTSLAASIAMISLQHCCIIDIGYNHTDICPIMDYTPIAHLTTTIPIGGTSINESLRRQLPNLTVDQIETLKKSSIFEVLNDEDVKKYSKFGDVHHNDIDVAADDDATLDVASIITSDRDTREVLAERERKKLENNVPNSELEKNTFIDSNGEEIVVGKQRFQGCDSLIQNISRRVGLVLGQVDDISKLRTMWENIVIIGGTSSIQGFKEALTSRLMRDHLVMEPIEERTQREQESIAAHTSTNTKGKKNKFVGATFVQDIEYLQAPTIIRLAKYPEYFPEWKKHGYGEISFLGAEIVSKQCFTHSKDNYYVTRESYEEKGPMALWDVEF